MNLVSIILISIYKSDFSWYWYWNKIRIVFWLVKWIQNIQSNIKYYIIVYSMSNQGKLKRQIKDNIPINELSRIYYLTIKLN